MTSGWIILDKPSGVNSRAAGARVARMFKVKKFGHLGTLDPMASGVLPIALGEATKMIPFIDVPVAGRWAITGEKEYEFSVRWGIQTDTDDITGKIIKEIPYPKLHIPNLSQIRAACAELVGEIEQVPPAYSAVHVNGRRAYELARRGEAPDLPARRIKIYKLEVSFQGSTAAQPPPNDTYMFRVRCGAGTYVRSLARDIAAKCGTIATCSSIRRTRTHDFEIKDAVPLDFLENLYNNACRAGTEAEHAKVWKHLRPADFGLDDILVLEINDNDAKAFKNGGFIEINGNGLRRVYNNGEFIGIGEIINGLLRPKRIINN